MLLLSWAISFVGIVILGVYAGRSIKNIVEWSLGGRALTWVDVGALIAAFQIGGTTIIGIAQNGFLIGYGGAWYSITGSLAIMVLVFFTTKMRSEMTEDSIPAYLKKRFGESVSNLYSYSYLLMGFFYIPIQLFALTTIIQVVIPGIDLMVAAIIGLLLSVSYSVVSGIQGAKTVGKVTCLLAYGFIAVGVIIILNRIGGMAKLRSELPSSYFSMGTMNTSTVIGWFISVLFAFLTMQAAIQPVLAGKDNKSARLGVIVGSLVALPIGFFTATTGLIAKVTLPEIESANSFVMTISTYLSPIFTGLIFGTVALIIATTLSSQVLAVGTIMKNIYVSKVNPTADDHKVLMVSRIMTFLFSVLTLIPMLSVSKATLSPIFVILLACGTGPMSFSILAGLYWKKATSKGAAISIILGLVTGISWLVAGLSSFLHPIYPIGVVTFLGGIVGSLLTYKGQETI